MLGKLFGLQESRAISFQTIFGSGDSFSLLNDSGTQIDQITSMRISAFYSAVLLISDTIATLPIDSFRRLNGDRVAYRPKPEWIETPDIDLLRSEHYQQVLVSLLLDGNAFVRIFRDNRGDVANLVCLDPTRIQISRNQVTKRPEYLIDNAAAGIVDFNDMVHITEIRKPGATRGLSRVHELKENLGLATALQSFAARFFGQGATTQGIIEFPGNLTKEQVDDLRRSFDSKHGGFRKAHKTGVLSGGAKYVKTSTNPDEAQMIASREFALEEIARIFRIPPSMLGITKPGAMSYASVEQNNINFVMHTLRPYVQKIEDAYSRLLPNQAFIKINVDGLLRGDFQTRISGYSVGLQSGFYSVNDIRRFEDLRPIDNGDQHRVPLANIDIQDTGVVTDDKKVQMATKLVQVGFDPSAVLKALDLPAMKHTGLPNIQLQNVAQLSPLDPLDIYEVN